jgi:glycosyltransferase involved in cell wall biosynthesis
VLSSTKRSRELTAFGYERIKLFSWEKCARQTLDVYKHVMRY